MKVGVKWLFAGALAVTAVSAVGYGNDDLDDRGHAFSDPAYYVMTVSSSGFDGGASLYDDGSHWADGCAPTGGKDYYVAKDHYLYAPPNSVYTTGGEKARYAQTFQGRSLTLGAWSGGLRLEGNSASKTAYVINFPDLRMRPLSKIYCWANSKTAAIRGRLTVLSEDERYPALILGPKADDARNATDHISGLNIFSDIVGGSLAQLCVTGFYEARDTPSANFTNGAYQCFIELLGDNSGYGGTVRIGSNALVTFAGGFPNGAVIADGVTYSGLNRQSITAPWSTAIGANSPASPTFRELTLADGVRIDCDTLITNATHITVRENYVQEGKVVLDFRGVELSAGEAGYRLMRLPTGTRAEADRFEVVNLADKSFELKVENDEVRVFNSRFDGAPEGSVTMVRQDTRLGNDGSAYAFYSSNTNGVVGAWWSDSQAPHEDADYYVGKGMGLATSVAWALVRNAGRQTYKLDAQGKWNGSSWTTVMPLVKFLGKSLTIGEGACFQHGGYDYSTAVEFPLIVEDFRFQAGSEFLSDCNRHRVAVVGEQTTMMILGTAAAPVLIWSGDDYNNANNQTGIMFRNKFTGDGVMRVAGGGANEKDSVVSPHALGFYGDNSGFKGTMLVGEGVSAKLGGIVRGNVKVGFSGSGLPNGSLVFDDVNSRLAITEKAGRGYVPVKDLTLCGNIIAADTFVTNNASYGFRVTGALAATGVSTFDFGDVNIPVGRVKLLAAPRTESVSLANFGIINAPTGYMLEVATIGDEKVLCAVNKDFRCKLRAADMPKDDIRLLAITIGETGEALDIADYAFGEDVDCGKYRFIKRRVGERETIYIENMACQEKGAYDVYQTRSDYQGRKAFDPGDTAPTQSFEFGDDSGWGHWSDGVAPHSGKSYATPDAMAIHLNTNGVHVFAGDSLTIGTRATARHETIFRVDATSDVTGDFRFMNGTQFFSAGSAVPSLEERDANTILRGELRVMAPEEDPMLVRYNADSTKVGAMRHCVIKSRLSGVKGAGIRLWNRSADAGATHSYRSTLYVDFTGDGSAYEGTIFCSTQSVVRVGGTGLPKGTVELCHPTAAFAEIGAASISVKRLKLVGGSTVRLNGAGLDVAEISISGEGRPVLDLGAVPDSLIETVLLSIPVAAGVSPEDFELVPGSVDRRGLRVETTGGVVRLVYEKPVVGTRLMFK